MNTLLRTLLAVAVLLASSGVAFAFPNFGGDCTSCHDQPGGDMTISPDPIEIIFDDICLVTFDVTDLGGSEDLAIAVSGLSDPNLEASIGGGGGNWTDQGGGVWTSDIFSSLGPYTLDLAIGATATLGDYGIGAQLVGNGERASTFDFTVSVIPEPTSALLLGIGLSAIVRMRIRRKHWLKGDKGTIARSP